MLPPFLWMVPKWNEDTQSSVTKESFRPMSHSHFFIEIYSSKPTTIFSLTKASNTLVVRKKQEF